MRTDSKRRSSDSASNVVNHLDCDFLMDNDEVCGHSRVDFLADIDRGLDDANERLGNQRCEGRPNADDAFDDKLSDVPCSEASLVGSEAASEASMNALMRYMGCTQTPYLKGTNPEGWIRSGLDGQYTHDLREGDHVIRWKLLGFCYPIQVHGIVFSAGPDFVTIVDCGWGSESALDKAGSSFAEQDEKDAKKSRRRMHILTIVEEKEIKKWTKIRYGEEVKLKVHSSNKELRQKFENRDSGGECSDTEESPSAGLELEEVETCVQAKIKPKPGKTSKQSPVKATMSWFCPSPRSEHIKNSEVDNKSKSTSRENPKPKSETLRLPKADPPILVLARLRFLLEYGEDPFPPLRNDEGGEKHPRENLLPPHHLLYANSECIAVFCKTGCWSTLQAAIFLHSSTVGNVKQSVTLAMFLSAQTVTIPSSGFWGFFGGTTTVSLFAAQPWLVPALVGGGVVYVGLPMIMLSKAKVRWATTERQLNDAFWSMCDSDVIVKIIQCWNGLES